MRFGERARIVKNKAKINREYSVEELKQLLAKANIKIEMQEKRIKALQAKIDQMGGKISEKELEKLVKEIPDAEEVKVQKDKDDIDVGESNLLDNLNDLQLEDGPFDAMAKRKQTMIAAGVQDSNIVSLEEFQAIEDAVKQLQEEMADEKEKYRNALKEIAELKEQLSYATERMKNAIAEKDKMAEKLEEYAQQMKAMKMKLDDKEDQIQELLTSKNIIEDEKKFLTESKDILQKKIDDMYDNYIFIAKDGDSTDESSESSARGNSDQASGIYGEIRNLHQEIKNQKYQITKLKELAMLYYYRQCPHCGGVPNEDPEADNDIKQITSAGKEEQKSASASEQEQDVIGCLCSDTKFD